MAARLLAGLFFALLFWIPEAHAFDVDLPQWQESQWWRGCASLDLDFYNDRYYINNNSTCDGTVGTTYTAGGGNTGVQNFIAGAGATFTRGGTSNTTATGIPFYLASNESFVSRGSTATYFNSSGVLSTAATNAARTNYGYNGSAWVSLGTLIEPASTNLIKNSGTVGGTNWALTNATATGGTSAPDGSSNGYQIADNSTSGNHDTAISLSALTNSTTYTYSVFAKAGTLSQFRLQYNNGVHGVFAQFSLSGNGSVVSSAAGGGLTEVSSSIQNVGGGWYYCTFTFITDTSPTSYSAALYLVNSSGQTTYAGGSGTLYFWGAQLELGSYPTSYIPTSGSTASRSADIYSAPGGATNVVDTSAPSYLASNLYYLSRNSTGTYFDSSGTLRYAPLYVSRTNYTYNGSSWVNSGTLIEPAATNILQYSSDFTQSFWTSLDVSVTIGASSSPSPPDGSAVIYELEETGSTGNHYVRSNITASYTGTFTLSVYAQAAQDNNFVLYMDDNSGHSLAYNFNLNTQVMTNTSHNTWTSYSSTMAYAGNGWYRCSITGTRTASTSLGVRISNSNGTNYDTFGLGSYAGATGNGVYIWGAQIEQGSVATSYIPTGGVTATRAADQYTTPYGATYYNSSGYVTSAPPNVPRLDYDPTITSCNTTASCPPKGVLIEESRTNLVLASQGQFSNSTYWTQNPGNRGVTMADNVAGTLSPDGTYDASSMTTTDLVNYGYTNSASTIAISTSTPYVVSAYVKNGGWTAGTQFGIYVSDGGSSDGAGVQINLNSNNVISCRNLSTGSCLATGVQALPNNWYRIWGEFETATTTNPYVFLSFNGSAVGTTYIYGVQVEPGTFPTSYIPTNASSVTRPADVFTLATTAGAGSGWYNSSASQGTIFASGILPYTSTAYTAIGSLDDGTSNNAADFVYSYTNGNMQAEFWNGGTHYGGISLAYTLGSTAKGAVAFQPGSQGSAVNATAAADSNAAVPTLSVLRVGNIRGGSQPLNGWVNRIWYMPTREPDTALADYTR